MFFSLSLNEGNPIYSRIETLFVVYVQSKHLKEDDNLFEDGKVFLFIAYVLNQDGDVLRFYQLHAIAEPNGLQHEEERNQNYLHNDSKQVLDFFSWFMVWIYKLHLNFTSKLLGSDACFVKLQPIYPVYSYRGHNKYELCIQSLKI